MWVTVQHSLSSENHYKDLLLKACGVQFVVSFTEPQTVSCQPSIVLSTSQLAMTQSCNLDKQCSVAYYMQTYLTVLNGNQCVITQGLL